MSCLPSRLRLTAKVIQLSVPELRGHTFGSKIMAASSTQHPLQASLEVSVNATTLPPNFPKSDSLKRSQRKVINTTYYAMS